jgi:hypothetical protein
MWNLSNVILAFGIFSVTPLIKAFDISQLTSVILSILPRTRAVP